MKEKKGPHKYKKLYKNRSKGNISKRKAKVEKPIEIQYPPNHKTTLSPLVCPRILSSRRRLYGAQYGSSDEPILARTPSCER